MSLTFTHAVQLCNPAVVTLEHICMQRGPGKRWLQWHQPARDVTVWRSCCPVRIKQIAWRRKQSNAHCLAASTLLTLPCPDVQGAKALNQPVHIQVSQASHKAKAAIEAAGGSVTTVYYNPLGLRALLKPEWFAKKGRLMPRAARPPPKLAPKFDRVGQLPVPSSLPTVPEGAAVP